MIALSSSRVLQVLQSIQCAVGNPLRYIFQETGVDYPRALLRQRNSDRNAGPNGICSRKANLLRIGQYSGMIRTCDEWPPAKCVSRNRSTVMKSSALMLVNRTAQGGAQAVTFCAPQNGRCGANIGPSTRSEQDFQSSAHSLLRAHVDGSTITPNGLYTFYFRTEYQPIANAPVARVVYYISPGDARQRGYSKRHLDNTTHLVSDEINDDLSVTTRSRLLTVDEVCHCEPLPPDPPLMTDATLASTTSRKARSGVAECDDACFYQPGQAALRGFA